MEYYTLPTSIGVNKLRDASFEQPINITRVVFGDAKGQEYLPTGEESELINQVFETAPSNIRTSTQNANWIEIEAIIPHNLGGWTIREVGCFDQEGDLIFIGNLPPSSKPNSETGVIKDIAFVLIYDAAAADVVQISINPELVLASRKYVDDENALHLSANDPHHQYLKKTDALNAYLAKDAQAQSAKTADKLGELLPSDFAQTDHNHGNIRVIDRSYSVSNTVIENLKNIDGNFFGGTALRVRGITTGTGTFNTDSEAIFWHDGVTWKVNQVSGIQSSNCVEFVIFNGKPSVKTAHPNKYLVRVHHEEFIHSQKASGAYFGLGQQLSVVNGHFKHNGYRVFTEDFPPSANATGALAVKGKANRVYCAAGTYINSSNYSSHPAIEMFQPTPQADAFISFHTGGDFAFNFGLHGATNKLSVGGGSLGTNNVYAIYHEGNKPSASELGITPETIGAVSVSSGDNIALETTTFGLTVYPTATKITPPGGWARAHRFASGADATKSGIFGAFGGGDSIAYMFISANTDDVIGYYDLNAFRVYPDRAAWGTNTIYHEGNLTPATIGALPVFRGAVYNVKKDTYTPVCRVQGDRLASAIKLTIHGTGSGNVVDCTLDILCNHYKDIVVSSLSGSFTQLDVKIESNGNEVYVISIKTGDSSSDNIITSLVWQVTSSTEDQVTTWNTDPNFTVKETHVHSTIKGSTNLTSSAGAGTPNHHVEGKEVYHEGNLTPATIDALPTSGGVITGDTRVDVNTTLMFGPDSIGNYGNIWHDENDFTIQTNKRNLSIDCQAAIIFKANGSGTSHINSEGMTFYDNKQLRLGGNSDTRMYHDGSNTRIEQYSGNLYFNSYGHGNDISFSARNTSGVSKKALEITADENVRAVLCYDGISKFEPTNTGAALTGELTQDGIPTPTQSKTNSYIYQLGALLSIAKADYGTNPKLLLWKVNGGTIEIDGSTFNEGDVIEIQSTNPVGLLTIKNPDGALYAPDGVNYGSTSHEMTISKACLIRVAFYTNNKAMVHFS